MGPSPPFRLLLGLTLFLSLTHATVTVSTPTQVAFIAAPSQVSTTQTPPLDFTPDLFGWSSFAFGRAARPRVLLPVVVVLLVKSVLLELLVLPVMLLRLVVLRVGILLLLALALRRIFVPVLVAAVERSESASCTLPHLPPSPCAPHSPLSLPPLPPNSRPPSPFTTTPFDLAIVPAAPSILGSYLLGLQAGNEPDMYNLHGHRPATYGPYDYGGEISDFF
ncbi:hypothetical protein B0H16DRAFT_1723345 [Mycena metata]|uniref:Uncharacterized protein n=1 Tax=Mycena metata TaxID=1033252 RepID=A0AAD7J266_9AGAR|nr:hypothetical protein B0H16DRAFT_1723345 [Mycena metata]